MEKKRRDAKRLERLMGMLKDSCILVEGKRDKRAMAALGCSDVIAVAGRTRQLRDAVKAKKVVVATDLDRRGNQLAARIRDELEGFAAVDCETRLAMGRLLKLKYFEDARRKYDEFYEKVNKTRGG